MRTTFGSATELASALLASAGVPEGPARRTAWVLVAAETWGRGSHGLLRLPYYLQRLDAGGLEAKAELRTVADRDVTLSLDGGNGLGHWQVWHAAEEAVPRARRWGISAVAVGNSSHCGALGLYLMPVVGAGLAGMVFSHGPAVIPPWGGAAPVTSTSPLAVGFPAGREPVVVDMACSAVARGKIAEAANAGGELPEGWALDRHGRPTTDPAEALSGMIAPLGGAKGFALALAVEGLTGGLVGPSLSTSVADPLDPGAAADPQRLAHLVVVVDPAALDVDGRSSERLARLAESVVEAGGRLPGAGHPPAGQLHDATGVTVSDVVARQLLDEASARGVRVPPGWEL
jgi:(2R)-3-sulfolactate dehydrogenase (NADP+)